MVSDCLVPYVEKYVFIHVSSDAIVKTFQEIRVEYGCDNVIIFYFH